MQTTVGYTSNVNRYPGPIIGTTTELDYSTLFLSGNYLFEGDQIVVGATVSPTFGDFSRLALDLSGQWNLTPYMNLILQYSFFANEGAPNDDLWSLRYRFEY
jgi:hypothetical protein